MKKTAALITAGTLLAVPLATVASAAHADPGDRSLRGACGGGTYEFQVEREDGG